MKDDHTTNSRNLTYTFSLYKVGRMDFLSLGMKGLNSPNHAVLSHYFVVVVLFLFCFVLFFFATYFNKCIEGTSRYWMDIVGRRGEKTSLGARESGGRGGALFGHLHAICRSLKNCSPGPYFSSIVSLFKPPKEYEWLPDGYCWTEEILLEGKRRGVWQWREGRGGGLSSVPLYAICRSHEKTFPYPLF